MRKVLKLAGYVVGALVVIIALAAAGLFVAFNGRANRTYTVIVPDPVIPTDAASLARGEHIATAISDCVGCHGPDLSGGAVIDDPAIGTIYSKNLTTGQGGVGGELTDAQFVMAIRHGIGPDDKSLVVMPSYDYQHLSDEDVADLVAYLRSVPPVDHVVPEPTIGPLGIVLTVLNALPTYTAELVDHTLTPSAPAAGVSVEYGHYLVQIAGCAGCHGANLGGGAVPGAGPEVPPAANITPSGELGQWTAEMFVSTIRTGVKPSGLPLNELMPYRTYSRMTDDELNAIFMYLQTVPPAEVK